jgi:hypothetical protein
MVLTLSARAQDERDTLRYKIDVQGGADTLTFPAPDIRTWHPEDATIDYHSVRPLISMTSLVTGMHREQPERIFVILPNNTLEAWGRVNVSNGQAWNWGQFPNSYLDARTLSFPAPR